MGGRGMRWGRGFGVVGAELSPLCPCRISIPMHQTFASALNFRGELG